MTTVLNGVTMTMFHQCCGCHLPAAPADVERYSITHGWHAECFRAWARDAEFEEEEIEEMLATNPTITTY